MEYWIKRGDSEYSYDLPEEARGMELLPELPAPAKLEERLEEVRLLLDPELCVLIDYFPAPGAYARVLDILQSDVGFVYLNAWRCGEGYEEWVISELRRAGSRSGIEPIDEAERTRIGDLEILAEPLKTGRALFIYPALPNGLLGEEGPATALALTLTLNSCIGGESREAVLSRLGKIDYVGLLLSPGGELLDVSINDPSLSRRYRIGVPGAADCVVVSAGGEPLDMNLYQSLNAALLAGNAVEDGGVVILSAECRGGVGSKRMVKAAYEAMKGPAQGEAGNDPFALSIKRLRELRKRASLCLVSALPKSYASSLFGLKLFDSTQEAVQYAVRAKGRGLTLYSIPHGMFTLPIIEEGTG